MVATDDPRNLIPADFFVLRTPLLPCEELQSWAQAGTATAAALAAGDADLQAAWEADRRQLRARLAAIFARPEIAEALFVASPSLAAELELWAKDPEGKKGQRVERALVRYFLRMAARPTPFGLFSGCSVGRVGGDAGVLHLGARAGYQRHTRLDMDYLFALTEDLGRLPELRHQLRYWPNSSLYPAGDRLRYAEARLQGKVRAHHLVAVDADTYLRAALATAAGGATVAELTAALAALDPEAGITPEDAAEYAGELIASQILVSDLSPPVTGPEPIHALIPQLAQLPAGSAAAERLAAARDALDALDAGGLGNAPERYHEIARGLEALPTRVELARLFQVDMVKPAPDLVLPAVVVTELQRAMSLLHGMTPPAPAGDLERFRDSFAERYGEGRELPLLEVLDEEVGIGFGSTRSGDVSPLLQGLPLVPPGTPQSVPWRRRQQLLLALLQRAVASGELAVELSEKELAALGGEPPTPLPGALQAMATIVAETPEAVAEGRFRLFFKGVYGPSGARLLGRFCHADAALEAGVHRHLAAEEALRPEAVFAEVVHLPEGRIGNILCRPVLRRWEIPFLGRSGAPPESQLPLSDLLVAVRGRRVVLRSRRLGREVVPRLSSAHNYGRRSIGVYRFLCELQGQGMLGGLGWSWGPLDAATFLPRVTSGRLVLARAMWQVEKDELRPAAAAQGAQRFRRVEEWRRSRRMPVQVCLADADNELLIDFANPLVTDTFIELVQERTQLRLVELFPGPEELCVRGPEGHFYHELILPFTAAPPAEAPAIVPPAGASTAGVASVAPVVRSFEPGSEWLYASLYCGAATADQLLQQVVAPVVRQALRSGAADRWFFIRYADPELHLRLRLHGEPARLVAEVLPALRAAVQPLLADRLVWRLRLDTYEREVERYGGPGGIELSEVLFGHDSEAVLAIVRMLSGDEGAEARWRLALRGVDDLFTDLGFDLETRLDLARRSRESYGREFEDGKGLRQELASRFRTLRRELESLLDPGQDRASELWPGLAALRRRSRQQAPVIAELRRRQDAGELSVPLQDLASSYAHMHVNRLIRASGRAHELVIYDFLVQLYESRLARQRRPR